MEPVVLAYSGGPQSSAAVHWLATTSGAEVVALTLDLGQGGDLEDVRDRALAAGAVRAHVLEVREEFARDYLLRALKANALYRGGRSLATLLGRPLIANRLVEIAGIERTTTVAHGSPLDQMQITNAVRALAPQMTVLVPPPAAASAAQPAHARVPADCPSEPAYVEITFEGGTPTALNAVAMPLLDLMGSLDILAGAHGVGRLAGLETPGMHVLASALAQLDAAVVPADTARFAAVIAHEYAKVIGNGAWFATLRPALDAFADAVQQGAAGCVRLKLFKGECTVVDTHPAPPVKGPSHAAARPLTFHANAKA